MNFETLHPESLREPMRAYIETSRPTGHFLAAVLRGDLFDAVGRADDESMSNLRGIVQWIVSNAPVGCWGNRDIVIEWIEAKRTEAAL